MNKSFDIKRFGKYFAYDLKSLWKEQRTFLLIWCLLPVIFYMVYMFFSLLAHAPYLFSGITVNRPPMAIRGGIFTTAAIFFIMLFPSRGYGFLTEKAKGSSWLMLPASRLEKFVSMVLICLVVVPLVFFCTYLLSDALVCLLDGKCGGSLLSSWSIVKDITGSDSRVWLGGNGIWFIVSWVLQVSSVFLLGALIFKKAKVTRTILALFAISMVLFALGAIFLSHADLPGLGLRFTDWAERHADHMDFWFNFWTNVELAIVVIGCGIWSWFKVRNLQH